MNRLPEPFPRRARAACTSLFVLCFAAAATSGAQVVDLSAVRHVSADPALIERARQVAALAHEGAGDELGRELQRVSQDAGLSAIAREWLLDRALHDAAQLVPTAALRAAVVSIARRRPEVFVRVDPDHGDRAVPLYDPGATARFVLRGWTRADARVRAVAALKGGNMWPLERFAQDGTAAELDDAKLGITDAFRVASPAVLVRYRTAVVSAIERGERVDELAAVMAERLADADLCALLIDHADASIALTAVLRARALFGDTRALDLLAAASRRSELASAALLQIGHLAREDAAARAQLFASMEDPALAPSAATALAALHDPAVTDELGRRLRNETRESSRRQLVLALQLDGSKAARGELERFAKTRRGSAELQKEVGAWLAR